MTTWKDPKIDIPTLCTKYWVLDDKNKTQVGRFYLDVGWVDIDYSQIKNVVAYAKMEAPPLPGESCCAEKWDEKHGYDEIYYDVIKILDKHNHFLIDRLKNFISNRTITAFNAGKAMEKPDGKKI